MRVERGNDGAFIDVGVRDEENEKEPRKRKRRFGSLGDQVYPVRRVKSSLFITSRHAKFQCIECKTKK